MPRRLAHRFALLAMLLTSACSSTKAAPAASSSPTATAASSSAAAIATTATASTASATTTGATSTGGVATTSAATVAAAVAPTTTPEPPPSTAAATTAPTPQRSAISTLTRSAITADMAGDPAGLAKQAVEAETTARNPNASADDRRKAGERQQLVYRILARHDDWVDPFFAQIPADIEPFARNNLNAAKAPLDPALSRPVPRKDTLPAWSVREALPADQLLAYYKEGEAKTGIEWVYLAAINMVETRFGRIVGLSTSDAMGPMQFLPTTWNGFCEGDPWNDHDAIVCAARYLKQRGGPSNMHRAIQGYNPNDMYEVMVTSYAANLRADPEALVGYHAWQIFQPTTAGDIRIPVGFRAETPISAADYLAAHPADLA